MDLFSETILGVIILYFIFVIVASNNVGMGSGSGFFDNLFGSKKQVFFSVYAGDFGEVKSTRRVFNLESGKNINLSAGKKQNKTIKQIQEEINIETTMLSEKNRVIEFETPVSYNNIFLDFDIDSKLDSMGNLIIKIGNSTIYDNLPQEKKILIEIPKDLINAENPKKNTITISAQKSQNILGKTHYAIRNFKIKYETLDLMKASFPIPLEDYEINGWHSGKIEFVVEEAIRNSPLKIIINNNIIYQEKPLALNNYNEEFSNLEAKMMPKENTLIFSTEPDSKYVLSNAHLIIKYYDTDSLTKKRYSFDLAKSDIKSMEKNKAKLNFTIEQITLNRPIEIKLNNFTTIIDNPRADNYEIALNKTTLSEEKNTLSFETNGAYKLGDIQVCLE